MNKQNQDSTPVPLFPDPLDAVEGSDEHIDLSDISGVSDAAETKRNTRREIEDYLESKRIRDLIADEFDDQDLDYQ